MIQVPDTLNLEQLGKAINKAKAAAKQYYDLTGRPLGITGEIGEYEAARLLNLQLAAVRQSGYDAICDDGTRIQIKTRRVLSDSKRGQRVGSIRLDREWDAVVLVLIDEDFEPTAIYEAQRPELEAVLLAPGSKSRNERGALGVRKFKSIAELVWSHDTTD